MGSDYLSDGVCIDEASIEDEWHEMLIQDDWLKIEVCWDERPCDEEWNEAKKSAARFVSTFATDSDDVESTMNC
jgi:hypothetical protein